MLTGPPICVESVVAELKVCDRGAKPYPGLIICRNELTTTLIYQNCSSSNFQEVKKTYGENKIFRRKISINHSFHKMSCYHYT